MPIIVMDVNKMGEELIAFPHCQMVQVYGKCTSPEEKAFLYPAQWITRNATFVAHTKITIAQKKMCVCVCLNMDDQ